MSLNGSNDFSVLPPLPKDHIKYNVEKQESKKCNGSSATIHDGEKIGEVCKGIENSLKDDKHNTIYAETCEHNNADSRNNSEDINNDKTVMEKKNVETEHNKNQTIDIELSSEAEKLQLTETESVKDGGSFGNVTKFSSFGSAKYRPVNEAVKSDAENYNMYHANRGHCLIFNNGEFEARTQLNNRNGTNQDRDALQILFTDLGFDVHVFDNLKLSALYAKLHEYAYGTDHRDSDCLVVFFLSHGEENMLFATDYAFEVQKLFTNFTADNCTSLAGKPKMFFVQACRGSGVDDGVVVYNSGRDQTDYSSPSLYKIPVHADFLICYSTIGAHFSWRNTINGSWFIQSIIKVFRERAASDDVLSMMTAVNRRMIIDFESNCPSSPDMHSKKQTACINSTLMRKIYLQSTK